MNELWVVREWMDHLIGGPTRTRGRTNPDRFVKGTCWTPGRSSGVDEGRRLDLLFNMKAPASVGWSSTSSPWSPGLTRLRVTAHWHPQGPGAGLLACHAAVSPLHLPGMTEAIARQAEAKAGIPVMD